MPNTHSDMYSDMYSNLCSNSYSRVHWMRRRRGPPVLIRGKGPRARRPSSNLLAALFASAAEPIVSLRHVWKANRGRRAQRLRRGNREVIQRPLHRPQHRAQHRPQQLPRDPLQLPRGRSASGPYHSGCKERVRLWRVPPARLARLSLSWASKRALSTMMRTMMRTRGVDTCRCGPPCLGSRPRRSDPRDASLQRRHLQAHSAHQCSGWRRSE